MSCGAYPGRQLLESNTPWLLPSFSPTYLTLQLENRSGGFYFNNWGADPAPKRAVTSTEQIGGLTQHPVEVQVTTIPISPCVCVCVCVCVHACAQLPRLLCPWYFSGKNTGVGSYFLLGWILPKSGIKPVSPASQMDSLPADPLRKPQSHPLLRRQ